MRAAGCEPHTCSAKTCPGPLPSVLRPLLLQFLTNDLPSSVLSPRLLCLCRNVCSNLEVCLFTGLNCLCHQRGWWQAEGLLMHAFTLTSRTSSGQHVDRDCVTHSISDNFLSRCSLASWGNSSALYTESKKSRARQGLKGYLPSDSVVGCRGSEYVTLKYVTLTY